MITKYLMANKLEWTKTDNLYPHEGNYHQYNHKVLFKTIRKNQKGGYAYEIDIQCCPLDKVKDYTLCIEILNTDYQLWHKSVATIDKQLVVPRYKSFLIDIQIIVRVLNTCIISK